MNLPALLKHVVGTVVTVTFSVLVTAPLVGQGDHPPVKELWHQISYWAIVFCSGTYAATFWWFEWHGHNKDPRRT